MMSRWFSPLVIVFGFAAASCSDPAGALPQGALYIDVGGAQCNTNPPPFSLPSGIDAVQAIRQSGGEGEDGTIYRVVDGDDDVEVECTVKGSDTFTISGRIFKPKTLNFRVEGEIPGSGGVVTMSEFDNSRVSTLSGECTLTPRYIDSGAIWADFDCPQFVEGLNTCSSSGVLVFENCKD